MSAVIPRYKRLGEHLIYLNVIKSCTTSKQSLLDTEGLEFVRVHKINSFKSLIIEYKENAAIVEEAVKKSDVCIAYLPSFVAVQVVKYAKKYNKPCLQLVIGCVWDAYWHHGILGKLIAPFRYCAVRNAVSKADYVIYVTQQFLQKRYPTNGRFLGCSNVILPSSSSQVLDEKLYKIERIKYEKRSLILTTLAAVNVRYKGQEYVIRAIAKLARRGIYYEYRLAGIGDPAYLLKLAERLGVSKQVIFCGVIPHDKVFTILDETDIYIQPSKQEGLPRALIEAMSRACPALGSCTAGIPELLDKDCIFRNGDVDAICRLLTSFDSEKMKLHAQRNYEESKKYELSLLEKQRNEFIDEFMENALEYRNGR